MTESPTPEQPKKRRTRKPKKDASMAGDPPIVTQQACNDVGDIAVPSPEKKKRSRPQRARTPRKRKPPAEIAPEMIAPDEPIASCAPEPAPAREPAPALAASAESARPVAPIPLAVPVGVPFPPTPPRPVRRSALTAQIVSLRASMLTPIEPVYVAPAAPSGWQAPRFVSMAKEALPKINGVLSRHPRSVGLAMTGLLLGVSLATIALLSQPSEQQIATQPEAPAPALAAAVPSAPLEQNVQTKPAKEENDPLAGVRIVDPSWEQRNSCKESAWPYIEQRCVVKEEARDARVDRKIGPGMIVRARPQPSENNASIGSTTAIVPATPRVTDGVALPETELDDRNNAAPKESATDGVATPETAFDERDRPTPKSVTDTVPAQVADAQTATIPTQTSKRAPRVRYITPQRSRKVQTFRLSEERSAPAPRRVANPKRKKQPQTTVAGRRTQRNIVSTAPQTPQFFFPFGWFVQAR